MVHLYTDTVRDPFPLTFGARSASLLLPSVRVCFFTIYITPVKEHVTNKMQGLTYTGNHTDSTANHFTARDHTMHQ